jgi:hypothetical protein
MKKVMTFLTLGALGLFANELTHNKQITNYQLCNKLKLIYSSCLQQAQKNKIAGNPQFCMALKKQVETLIVQKVQQQINNPKKVKAVGELIGDVCAAGCLQKKDVWDYLNNCNIKHQK